MRRYWLVTVGLLLTFLALFGLAQLVGVDVLVDPSERLQRGGPVAAALSFALLVVDVFLPVPSSLVMVANGALFGVGGGAALSVAGSLGATLLGFFIGRRSGGLIERLVSPHEKARADALLNRWGALAILITRPLPLVAETVAILAGASPLGWLRSTCATVVGTAPWCLIYAWTGATSRGVHAGVAADGAPTLAVFVVMVGVVAAIAGLLYWFGRRA